MYQALYSRQRLLFLTKSLLFILCIWSCADDKTDEQPTTVTNSVIFCQAVLDEDNSMLISLMEEFTKDLNPVSMTNDPIGHSSNLKTLVQELDKLECLKASEECYACLESLPAQSLIKIQTDLNGVQKEVSFHISTPDNGPLLFLGLN